MPELRTPALFLDRDGVINHEIGYLHRAEDVTWVDGIFSLVGTAIELGYKIVVITNQAGIGRGLYTLRQFEALMDWMRAEFAARGCVLHGVYFCAHHPEAVIAEYRGDHPDRKPNPGMLLRAAEDLQLDLARSILIGDRCSDLAAAHAAGLRQAFLLSGTEPAGCDKPHQRIDSLTVAEAWLRDAHPRSA